MAKGRRHHARFAERLLASVANHGGAAQSSPAVGDPDLDEGDVWSSHAFSGGGGGGDDDFGRVPFPDRDPRRARRWAPDRRQVGGLSLAFEDDGRGAARPTVVHQHRNVEPSPSGPRGRSGGSAVAASAPVNVPSWPSFLRSDAVEAGGLDAAADDEDDDEWLPPHEYLAREHRNSAMATSVFEGVGRTLKGRDMSRVRDAVWSRTGFFG